MTVPFRLVVHRQDARPPASAGHAVQFFLRVPTELEVVEEAVDLVARHCVASGLTPRRARFHLRVMLAEALTNAIVYGNAMDPQKQVDVRVVLSEDIVTIHVQDEGNGFNPAQIPDPTEPDRVERIDGRGLFLIRQLADEVHFNERGNAICMILRCA